MQMRVRCQQQDPSSAAWQACSLTGQIVQYGVRGVLHRQLCADFLVCVVVVVLALLLRGCRWQRLGASEAPNGAPKLAVMLFWVVLFWAVHFLYNTYTLAIFKCISDRLR